MLSAVRCARCEYVQPETEFPRGAAECRTCEAGLRRARHVACRVSFCGTTARVAGLCRRHATDVELGRPFRRPLRSPDPEELAALDGQRLVNYLMVFTEKDPTTRCRLWQGATDGAGYACVSIPGSSVQRTYRVVVEAISGPIPPGYHVHHKCAVRRCINPDHLERSDARENIGEMLARQGFLRYIGALRSALAEYDPGHWLLASRVETFDGTPDSPAVTPSRQPLPIG